MKFLQRKCVCVCLKEEGRGERGMGYCIINGLPVYKLLASGASAFKFVHFQYDIITIFDVKT